SGGPTSAPEHWSVSASLPATSSRPRVWHAPRRPSLHSSPGSWLSLCRSSPSFPCSVRPVRVLLDGMHFSALLSLSLAFFFLPRRQMLPRHLRWLRFC